MVSSDGRLEKAPGATQDSWLLDNTLKEGTRGIISYNITQVFIFAVYQTSKINILNFKYQNF